MLKDKAVENRNGRIKELEVELGTAYDLAIRLRAEAIEARKKEVKILFDPDATDDEKKAAAKERKEIDVRLDAVNSLIFITERQARGVSRKAFPWC